MDPVYLIWLFASGAVLGGAIIGAIVYRNLTPNIKQADSLKAELDEARQEMEGYKTSVNSHFDKTAELVNELTQDYVKVYKHLAEGAQALGDGRDFTNVLEQHQGKVLISVDGGENVQDTVVSEVPADAQAAQESPPGSAEPGNEKVAQEDSADSKENVEAEAEIEDASELLAEQGENKDPVINVDKLDADLDDGLAAAKPEKGNGSEALKENLSAKTEAQKESAPTPSA
ncbi:MAG: YhcB family protein [Gammaproteobacteria bacterium]|nr:YhcB family protein [Gammaproteobacteria bacterium]